MENLVHMKLQLNYNNIGSNNKMKNWNYYHEEELTSLIAELTERFEEACDIYKKALSSRTSNRATKELSRDNSRGTAIHKFQCNFAWLIHSIQKEHESLVDSNIKQANMLINHICTISDK